MTSIEVVPNAPHGTPNGYFNYRCRCSRCKTAGREYQLPRTKDRWARGLPEGDSRHGTYNGYLNYGCRCGFCKEANRVYAIGYRLKRGLITRERAEELIAKGRVMGDTAPAGWMRIDTGGDDD